MTTVQCSGHLEFGIVEAIEVHIEVQRHLLGLHRAHPRALFFFNEYKQQQKTTPAAAAAADAAVTYIVSKSSKLSFFRGNKGTAAAVTVAPAVNAPAAAAVVRDHKIKSSFPRRKIKH